MGGEDLIREDQVLDCGGAVRIPIAVASMRASRHATKRLHFW
jgi:hypothetical protein